MKIFTFSEAAQHFEVSLATISRWVKTGKLEEGAKAGKIKTVTKKSVEKLSKDDAFQIALQSIKKGKSKNKKTKVESKENLEIKELKSKIENLENLTTKLSKEVKDLQYLVQSSNKEKGTDDLHKKTKNVAKKRKVTKKNKNN